MDVRQTPSIRPAYFSSLRSANELINTALAV